MSKRPMGFWIERLADALEAHGGEARLPDLYVWMEKNVHLTERELEASPYQGRPYFQITVRGVARNMVKAGRIQRLASGRFRLI